MLQVASNALDDGGSGPEFLEPYPVRFQVNPVVLLEPEFAVPIQADEVWSSLSITNQHDKASRHWTGFFRGSLNMFNEVDGKFLADLLRNRETNRHRYPLTPKEQRELSRKARIRALDREVEVEIPDHEEDQIEPDPTTIPLTTPTSSRESIQAQANVAYLGAKMGFHVWLPKADRSRVLDILLPELHDQVLSELPLNYDDNTLRTIEQIDVLWLKGRAMAQAFEIEHTTAIYSGLLRMADLLALQPNMDIRLHIVAPEERQERVLREIRRPVFSLLDRGPLYEQCSFLSYDAINSLSQEKSLSHMRDTILADYEISAEVLTRSGFRFPYRFSVTHPKHSLTSINFAIINQRAHA